MRAKGRVLIDHNDKRPDWTVESILSVQPDPQPHRGREMVSPDLNTHAVRK